MGGKSGKDILSIDPVTGYLLGGDDGMPSNTIGAEGMMALAREEADIGRGYLQEQTTANRPDQFNPWGSSVWEDLGDNQWRQTVDINPDAQRALEAQQGLGAERTELAGDLFGRVSEDLSAPIGWEAMEANEVGTGEEARQRAEEAIYGRTASRLDPQWEQRSEATYNQLWNQGLRPGDEAWDTAMGNLERAKTDAYQTANREAIMGGGLEASRTQGLDMSRRQQALSEQLRRRTQGLGEIGALTAGQGATAPQFSGFSQAGRAMAPNLTGAAQAGMGAEWDRYSARQAEDQAMMSGLMGTAAAVAPFFFSDRRLKSDIVHVGYTGAGQCVYEYTIFNTRQIGVMADESPTEAVHRHPSGYLMVDYSRIK